MTLEKLKKMLEDGAIDQKEYDEMIEKLGLKEDGKKGDKKDDKGKGTLPENIQSLIQSAVDRATNKIGNENKELRKQLEDLRKEKLSDDEIKKLELDEKLKLIADKEKEIKDKELRMFAIKAIKDAGLDDGSDTALSLVDVLMGADEDSITAKTKNFKALLDKTVESQVQQRFKDSGRDMGKGGSDDKGDGKGDKDDDNIAVKLAKATSENNKATQSIIEHYSGGKE